MLNNAIKLLQNSKKIAVFTHINPDGDALGSSIAFKLGLEQLGKQVDLYCDDVIHENYHFLGTKDYYTEHEQKEYDLAVILDCPEISRVGRYGGLFQKAAKKMVIDHHLHNSITCDASLIDQCSGSVGVMIYRLFKAMDIDIDKQIALPMYAAVASDTGSFMYSNTTQESHIIAAELLGLGLDLEVINYFLFQRKTKKQIALFAKALQNIEYHEDNKIAIVTIEQNDFAALQATYIDTVGIPSYIGGIDGVSVAVLLTEYKENCYILSLRSSVVDTSEIAKTFNGGGHANASGCKICGKKENVMNRLLEACKKELR